MQRRRRGSLIVGWTDRVDGHGQQAMEGARIMAREQPSENVLIGKFDLVAA
jgi:hypothetical protein